MSNIYNNAYVNTAIQPQFFGEQLNIARNDVIKYPKIEKLYESQFSFFWQPEEIDLKQDARDWKKMSPIEQRIYEKNLAYQILLDSVQERAPTLAFLPHVSLPELEQLFIEWSFFELIHSKSYQHILRNLYNNPTEVFDDVINDASIRARAESVVAYYDNFIDYGRLYSQYGFNIVTVTVNNVTIVHDINEYELYKRLYLSLINVFFLESIRFYISFASSFYFAEQRNILKGNANIITLIARDEKLHTSFTLAIINNYKRTENNSIMLQVMKDCEVDVLRLYDMTMNQEREWIRYLFKDGSLLGWNEEIANNYLDHIGESRLVNLGIDSGRKHIKNPITWVDKYLNPKSTAKAPQEIEIVEYLAGATSHDEFDLDNYSDLNNI